jgi:hypothetical protein
MANEKKKRAVVRMNLEMSRQVRETLERIGEESDLTLSEVLRRSLAVYDLLWTQVRDGGTIVIRTKKGEREVVFV